MKTVRLDKTAEMMLNQYYKTLAEEPKIPHPDEVLHHQHAEASAQHYEWQRKADSYRLILMHHLLGLLLDQDKVQS